MRRELECTGVGAVKGAVRIFSLMFAFAIGSAASGCVDANAGTADRGDSGTTSGHATSTEVGPGSSAGVDDTAATMCDDPSVDAPQIFATHCSDAGCHGPDAAAGLDLVSDGWLRRLVGQPSTLCEGWLRVVPGDPATSMLADKLHATVACGETMPVGASLAPSQIQCIEQWIAQLPAARCDTCGGQACIDLDTDPLHCGQCDEPCPTGIPCAEGQCVCPSGTTHCGDACVNTLANVEHCGDCGLPCEGGLVCFAGACVDGCDALTDCGGGCVNTDIDPQHCGGCDSPCPSGGSCVGGSCGCPGPALSYATDIEPLFVADCTSMGCHGFPMPQDGLDLRVGAGYADLVGVPADQCSERTLVAPGQADDSYLMDKLLGADLCMGNRMPKGDDPYTPEQLDLIAAWICQGAPP